MGGWWWGVGGWRRGGRRVSNNTLARWVVHCTTYTKEDSQNGRTPTSTTCVASHGSGCHSSDHTSALRHHQELNLQVPGQRQETGRTHPRARGVVHGHHVPDSRLVSSLLPLAVERLLLVLHVGEPRDAAQRARAGQIEEDSECEAERAVLLVLISASSTPPQPPRNCGGSLDAALAIQASHQPPIVVCGVGCVVCVGGVVVGGGGGEGRRGFCCDVTEMCVSISLHSCTESWGHVPVYMAPRPCASHKAPKTTPSTWSPVVATRRARRTRMNAWGHRGLGTMHHSPLETQVRHSEARRSKGLHHTLP